MQACHSRTSRQGAARAERTDPCLPLVISNSTQEACRAKKACHAKESDVKPSCGTRTCPDRLPLPPLPSPLQGCLLLLATELLPLGSLREALQQRELRRELRWSIG